MLRQSLGDSHRCLIAQHRGGCERIVSNDSISAQDDVRPRRTVLLVVPGMLTKKVVERCSAAIEPGHFVALLKRNWAVEGRRGCHREHSLLSRACAVQGSPAQEHR